MSLFFSKQIIFLLVFILIVVGVIFIFPKKAETPTTTKEANTENVSVKGTGDFTIKPLPVGENLTPPSLDSSINYATSITPEAKKILAADIERFRAALKKNPEDLNSWLELGLRYKMAGDYREAREVWEYSASLTPSDYISLANLGDLYRSYLKDYGKAEVNLLKAVKNKPDFIGGYRSLYELYYYSYKEKIAEAPKILLQGLTANPKSVDLMILLAQYYRDADDKTNALFYYDKAISELTKTDATSRLEAVKSDRATLSIP